MIRFSSSKYDDESEESEVDMEGYFNCTCRPDTSGTQLYSAFAVDLPSNRTHRAQKTMKLLAGLYQVMNIENKGFF